jgi:maleylpyruvate isomerase
MGTLEGQGPALCAAVARRSAQIHEALVGLTDQELEAPSLLEDWSRLTIACHLRYGAGALTRMTADARSGRPTSYYPEGRGAQRPSTLEPSPGETPADVVLSLRSGDDALNVAWRDLAASDWAIHVTEPAGAVDLGPIPLVRLPLLRLTELEVHGSDLGLGGALDQWSHEFVSLALPFRLDWLNTRRSNHRAVDATVEGSWLLVASDGPTYLVSVAGDHVTSAPASPTTAATAIIEGVGRDLLALLLGRHVRHPLGLSGDQDFALSFQRAFPGP